MARVNKLKFNKMIREARQGDERAEQELRAYLRRTVPYANKNLKALEEAGLTDYAYGRAMRFLNIDEGASRFSASSIGRSTDDLADMAEEVHTFLASSTHTVRGASRAWSKQLNGLMTLNDLGYKVSTDQDVIKRVSKALGNDGLKFKGAERYQLMEALSTALEEKNLTDPEIQLIIDRYASGEIIYDKMLAELVR